MEQTPEMKLRLRESAKTAGILLAAGIAYFLFVKITGWGIPCLLTLVTGGLCPGCGITRMFLALTRLDFYAAFRYNALVFCLMPFAAVFGLRHWRRWVKTGSRKMDRMENVMIMIAFVLTVVFWILRNLPQFSFLAP